MQDLPLILQAFAPEEAVLSPDMFAGREAQIRELAESLHDRGSVPIIYGHRGVGKTSIALQYEALALGDRTLLDRIGASSLQLTALSAYNVLWMQASQITGVASLAEALKASVQSEYLPAAPRYKPTKRTRTVGVNVKAFKGETSSEFEYNSEGGAEHPTESLDQVLESYR